MTDQNVQSVWLFRVERVEQRTKKRWVRGTGESTEFDSIPLGWHVVCSGNVAFNVGDEKPDLRRGDTLELRKRSDK